MNAPPPVSIFAIFLVFARIGLLSFGGGMSGWVYREIVQARGWLSEEEFLSGLSISQILPGTNVSNLSVYIGQKLRGGAGAVTAVFGLLVGPFFAVVGLASVYGALKVVPWVESVLDGVTAAALGLLILVCYKSVRRTTRRLPSIVAFLATFLCVAILRLPFIPVVVCVGAASVFVAWPRGTGSDA